MAGPPPRVAVGHNRSMPFPVRAALPVWVVAVVGAVVVAVTLVPSDRLHWISVVMAVCVVLTFVLQLAIVRKEGIVVRMMVSIGGSIVLLGVATLVLRLIDVLGS
jgi:tellurite resistance protein TehA-like permease